jgi:hypothetical protein
VNDGVERRCESRRPYRLSGPLECIECGAVAGPKAAGWRGYRIDVPEEDEQPAVAFYCLDCAIREFG